MSTRDSFGPAHSPLTRREVIKRGLTLGALATWATPAIQVIGVGRAAAEEPSAACATYCLKFEFNSVGVGAWGPLGGGQNKGKGNCLVCPDEGVDGAPDALVEALNAATVGSPPTGFTVTLPVSCHVIEATDETGSPDFFGGLFAAVSKCGQNCTDAGPVDPDVRPQEVFFPTCNGKDISHIEMIIKCCPPVESD